MAKKIDVTGWWTTEQVARELGVKVRTIHHHVYNGKLHPQKYLRPGVGGGAVNVFDPEEVQTFLQQRMDAKTEIVPAGDAGESVAIVPARQNLDLARIVEAWQAQPFPIDKKAYLTLDEAVRYTGLGKKYLRENCAGQLIGPHDSLVFKRKDLDKL